MAYAPDFDNVELDREICREASGGPGGLTTVINSGNAKEQRNVEWPDSLRSWNVIWVAHAEDAKFRNLINFFHARRYRAYGFRFFDWSDNSDWGYGQVLLDASIGKYRLYKVYPDVIRPTYRKVYAPIQGTITLHDVDDATAVNIDYTTGVIASATGPGTWTGQFNIPARFDSDSMLYRITPDLNVIWNGMSVVELA